MYERSETSKYLLKGEPQSCKDEGDKSQDEVEGVIDGGFGGKIPPLKKPAAGEKKPAAGEQSPLGRKIKTGRGTRRRRSRLRVPKSPHHRVRKIPIYENRF